MSLSNWNCSFDKNLFFAMILCGSRRSGKSYLIKHLYMNYWKNQYDFVVVFSNSINNDFYGEFICSKLLYKQFDPEVIDMVFEKSDELSMNGKKASWLIIFDDCVSNKQKYNDKILQCFSRGRHSNVSIVFATQSFSLVDSNWRENIDYLVIFRQKSASKKELIIDTFLEGLVDEKDYSGFKEKKFWHKLINSNCLNHQCLVIDFIQESDRYKDFIFKFKAN